MPNFLMMSELKQLPEVKKYKGGRGGGNIDVAGQMRQQEEMMGRQVAMQQQYQIEAESRFRAESDRQRNLEYLNRQTAAAAKEERYKKQQQQETALVSEMTGQSKSESNDFGGGFNLAMPTIERPGYESISRPI
jgi:hypothetical protein